MQSVGLILAILIGISLALIGSGGSILTIPTLVYIMLISPSVATTYSLFIVGISALVGSIKGAKERLLDFKMVLYFGLPSILSIYIMRQFIVPLLPGTFFTITNFTVTKDIFIMCVFAVLMILASTFMIRKKLDKVDDKQTVNLKAIILKGILIGLLTGFVGVGGGFLIIPTLLFSAQLTMKKAVATSLIIIAFNALIGFAGSLQNTIIDWTFLLKFTTCSIIGIFIGFILSKKMSNEKLKPIFGWFVLFTGIYILTKEVFFN